MAANTEDEGRGGRPLCLPRQTSGLVRLGLCPSCVLRQDFSDF